MKKGKKTTKKDTSDYLNNPFVIAGSLLIIFLIIFGGIKLMENDSSIVEIQTNKGVIIAEIYVDQAPITANNFLGLVDEKFYDGLTFHRYVPGFVIQGGDPEGTGMGGSGNTIPLEIVPELKHVKGALAMARSQDPDSASSQFYITLEAQPSLDGNYAVFGKVIEGMDVVESLRKGDNIVKIRRA